MKTVQLSRYGKLNNIIRFEQVYMVTHNEGEGTSENPQREVHTFFTKEARFIARVDNFKPTTI